MFPPTFFPRPHRFLSEASMRPPSQESRGRSQGPWNCEVAPSSNELDKWTKEEEQTFSRDLPHVYPKPVGQPEFKQPPPPPAGGGNKCLPACSRSPVQFALPPPKHFVSQWTTTSGRVSPTVNILSPAGQYYPPSPRPPFPPTTGLHPNYAPPSPSFHHAYAPPSPSLSYYSGKPSGRTRTLIEIPRHDSVHGLTSDMFKPDPRPSRKVSVSESTLDPNSRPFTPSGRYHTSSICASDAGSNQDEHRYESEVYGEQTESDDFYYDQSEQFQFQWEYDPLPEDPMTLLPDLETSVEDMNNNNNCHVNNNNNNVEAYPRKVKSLLPPLVPDSAWKSGSLRPPLLPTPVNFPPFGPSRLEPLSFRTNVFSDGDSSTKMGPESRVLVSGVEQTINLIAMNGQNANQNNQNRLLDSAEKKRQRTRSPLRQSGIVAAMPRLPRLPPPAFSTGGIFSQNVSVPTEYLMSQIVGDKIKNINIRQEHTDLLFFLFYTLHGDALQLVAASLLFERGWRYHKQDKIWLARWPGVKPEEKTASFEKGLYQYFDMVSWKRIPGWFRLDYCHLAEKTLVPEDLKTLYTRYSGVMREVMIACARSMILSGFSEEASDEFSKIDGIKYLGCII